MADKLYQGSGDSPKSAIKAAAEKALEEVPQGFDIVSWKLVGLSGTNGGFAHLTSFDAEVSAIPGDKRAPTSQT